jgi:hypothetical protein
MMINTTSLTIAGTRDPASELKQTGRRPRVENRAATPQQATVLDWSPRLRLGLVRLGMGSGMVHPFGLAFQRHVDVLYETCVLRLTEWAQHSARLGTVKVGRSQLTVPARDAFRFGRGHIDVRLGRGPLRPSLPMDLDVLRWSSAFGSVLELNPARGVRPDTRYYREGNAVLDRIAAVIEGRAV